MSWVEYNDMFERAQREGRYQIFIFDLKGSRNAGYFHPYINLLLYGIYFRIKDLEKEMDKKILHQNSVFNKGNRGDLMEPFYTLGDLFGFTIIKNSLLEEDIYNIFKDVKKELNLDYEFYYDTGFYETDDYLEAEEKYFRGYCMQYLEDRAKVKDSLL